MPRTARIAPGGVIFHVLNRGVGRQKIFHKPEDYAAFERVLAHSLAAVPIKLFAYCFMPNHWHLMLAPIDDGQLAAFMARLTMTHTRRWQEHYAKVGEGHLYQGRFKSFPIQEDNHFLIVARYIERNPLRAKLVELAQDWRWSSLWKPQSQNAELNSSTIPLAEWPVERSVDWLQWVQEPQTDKELEEVRLSVTRGRPFGDQRWQDLTTSRLRLESTHRKPGRPKGITADSQPYLG